MRYNKTMKKILKLCISLTLIVQIIILSGCSDNNSNNSNTSMSSEEEITTQVEKIELTEDNIDEYLYYTYIYNSDNMSKKVYIGHYIYYNAYTLEINFYSKKKNVKFDNCVIALGGYKDSEEYIYTVYINEDGSGQYKNQIWAQVGFEKNVFNKMYYSIQGNIIIF